MKEAMQIKESWIVKVEWYKKNICN